MVRRIPDGNQASFHVEVQGLPWDTLKGSAEMLRNATVRLGEPPRPSRGRPRKDGSPAQARTTMTSGHEANRDDSEGISTEEQARRRLRSKQPVRRSLTDDETVSKRLKREATIAAIKQEILKTVAERPDLEHAHKFYSSIRSLRSPESIHASRMVEINKWRERGVVERWSRQAAMAAGRQNVQCTLGG